MTLPPLPLNAWLRYDLADRTLRRLEDVRTVLEVGPGEGAIGTRLARRYEYVGVEPDESACARARERIEPEGRVLCGDVSAVEPGATFDLVCGFEVLEHIEDDAAILAEWRERVREGGWLLLSVPAHQRRFGAHDRVVGHYRRYDPAAIAALLERSGFADPIVLSSGFPLGYLLELARNSIVARLAKPERSMDDQTADSGRWLQPPAWLGPALRAFSAPFRWLQRPFARTGWGTGLVVLARRA